LRVKGLQLAGALVAGATLVAVWVLPRPAPQLAPAPEPAVAATDAQRSPSPPPATPRAEAKPKPKGTTVDNVEKLLARKMPAVEPSERLRLARAILEESRFAALDPLFVVALIAVESGFDHGAESVRGARGLMQLRENTLAAEAERSNLDGDLDDPVTNVRAGVRYYRRLVRAFGDHEIALMAYNAGPNRILKYLREEGAVPARFLAYPRKVKAELSKLQKGGVPSGRGSTKPLGPVEDPGPLELPPLAPPEPAVEVSAAPVR
jgi:soluble lytic murein transglycosylase-like protein